MLTFSDGRPVAVIGWRVYYGDGSALSSRDQAEWSLAPSENVQCVVLFYDRTYQSFVDGVWKTFNYTETLHGGNYFWFSPSKQVFGMNPPDPIPEDAQQKVGKLLHDDQFRAVYNMTLNDRIW